ncbi:TRAP transporter substrate-binding protein [Desulforegula conservatrix]|uniref:TRAP transporter substrate-binding protein n=1 Tax=Desulforegula conservatrix TaxID=153026 RepID=UPI0004020D39|nr:TRAP transporter substrate-binding protein [Desulforegula conservatrix]
MNSNLTRRNFLKISGILGTVLPSISSAYNRNTPEYTWTMATAWPKGLPGAGSGALLAAQIIEILSNGRIKIKVYGAGEICEAFEIFDTVSSGEIELGHATGYYWSEKHPLCQLFSSTPFGLNPFEMIAWLESGGGQLFWDELYENFNLKPFACGNTGIQMGGWFNKEINDISDFKSLKIRFLGIGSQILKRAGAIPIKVPVDKILALLKSGEIDAADWIAPFDDQKIGLHLAAKYYYWPGWHEPGTLGELIINRELYLSLDDDLQEIIKQACLAVYLNMWTEYSANNGDALLNLLGVHKIKLKRFNDKTLLQLSQISTQIIDEIANSDQLSGKTIKSYRDFKKKCMAWNQIGEESYSLSRSLIYSEIS